MIQLPDLRKDPKETADLCKCRPICKSRHREWRGKVQNTSAELLLERKPKAECFRRYPKRVYPNSPCPLFGRSKRVVVHERDASPAHVVRICQAEVDAREDTPYLRFAEMARKLGAWGAVRAQCPFCVCGAWCPCALSGYAPRDHDDSAHMRADMRNFDARVKHDCASMRIMYDKP